VAATIDRYKFAAYPSTFEDMQKPSMDFFHGLFEDIAIAKLSIFSDGIAIESKSNSKLLERFLKDLLGWAEAELDIAIIHPYKYSCIYNSDIVFQTEKDIYSPLKKFKRAQDFLSQRLLDSSGIEISWESFGWSFGYDANRTAGPKPGMFRVERKLNTDHSLNQYFSTAPLSTDDHIELLKVVESIV
jgi:hypothetical protein